MFSDVLCIQSYTHPHVNSRKYAEFLTILWLRRLVYAATNSSLQFVLGQRVLLASEVAPKKVCWNPGTLGSTLVAGFSIGDRHTNFPSHISSFALEAIQTSQKKGCSSLQAALRFQIMDFMFISLR